MTVGLVPNFMLEKKMSFEFCVIDGKTSFEIINEYPEEVFNFIRKTYLAHEAGQTINPPSYFFKIPEKADARIIALPAAITDDDKVVGIKWIGSNPANIQHHFPRASATIILNDYETFYPYACLEGSIISAVRTAYSAVLAATEIKQHDKKIKKLGIVGNGLIAKYIYKAFIAQGWRISEILLFDKAEEYSKKFSTYLHGDQHESVQIVKSLDELLIQSDMIVFATSALEPYIHDITLFNHNPILLNISLRDLDPKILLHSNNIVDDIEHVLQAKTSPDLAYQLCNHKNFINGTIGSLIQKKIVLDHNKPTVFSPMGMGILDVALAYFIYKNAKENSKTVEIPDFFFDVER